MNERERRIRSWIDLGLLFVVAVVIFFVFVYVGSANGATTLKCDGTPAPPRFVGPPCKFRVGLVNPTPVPASISSELGSTVQRYDLIWPGPTKVVTTSSTTALLAVYPQPNVYRAKDAPAFCAWLGAILSRHRFAYVMVGIEPARAQRDAYVAFLRACSPIVHAHDAKVVGPGLHPAGPVSYLWPTIDTIARDCLNCLDVLSFHPYWYSSLGYDAAVVNHARQAFGWNIPVWITEDGERVSTSSEAAQAQRIGVDVAAARCAGVSVWLNFLLHDALPWDSGLFTIDGRRKPAFTAFARAARSAPKCPEKAPAPPPIGRWTPDERLAQRLGEVGGWTRDAYEVAA